MERVSPESVGISSGAVAELLDALSSAEGVNVHSIVIARDGKMIAEASQRGYSARVPHLSHSMSKSVVGIMIMQLLADKKLDTGRLVLDFFTESELADKRMRHLTVKHLLTMMSGVGFGEAGVVSEENWTSAYLLSDMSFTPGERFAYNSMNSYILTVIADKICRREYGMSAEDFINARILAPLGIARPLWERSPEGIIKGGFGLYLSCEDWATIGCAVLASATGGARNIIPHDVLSECISERVKTDSAVGDFDYGYHLWVGKDERSLLFNGMFGQNVLIDLKASLVIAINSGNNELFSKSTTVSVIRDALSKNVTRGQTFGERRRLRRAESAFFENRRWIKSRSKNPLFALSLLPSRGAALEPFSELVGEYSFPTNNHSLIPSFVRIMQNNFTGGISSFTVYKRHGLLHLRSNEATVSIDITFGLFSHVRGEIDVLGEKYSIMAMAEAEHTPSGDVIYKLEIIFPELPNSRRMTLERTELGRLHVRMYEMPDERITDAFVDAIPTLSGRIGLGYRLLEQNLGKNFIEGKLRELFSPEFTAFSTDSADHDAALREENERIAEIIASSRLVRSLIFNFLGNEEKMRENGGGALGKIAGLIGRLF